MSPASCCTSRRPPSPSGLAPRPILVPHGSRQGKVVEVYFPSISSSSRLSGPEDLAELQAIFESDKSSAESKRECIKTNESSNTLRIVTSKLRKHLSRDSGVSKRLSRSSIGTSEEDIQRRAELRRIRHKRIKEELSSGGIYDEDAISMHSVVIASSTKGHHGRQSPLALPELPAPQLPELSTPPSQSVSSPIA